MPYNTYVPMGTSFAQPQQPVYQQQPQQPQQGSGNNMLGLGQFGLDAYKSGMFSSSAVQGDIGLAGPQVIGGEGALGAGAPGTGGASAGGASAGGSGSSGMAAAGPWAALAAVIIANESEAEKAGRRDEDRSSRGVDMLSGAVLEQDTDYYGDKVGGGLGRLIQIGGQLGNPEGALQFTKDFTKKNIKNAFTPWKVFS